MRTHPLRKLLFISVLLITSISSAQRADIPAGFPDASTTGCSGTLTASSSIYVTTDNTVIENLEVTGTIHVQANNVTIRNCHITGGVYGVNANYGYSGTLIEDCTIDNLGSKGIVGCGFTALRCDISVCYDGMEVMGNGVHVEDCYIHDLTLLDWTHNDCIQTHVFHDMIIKHNTLQSLYQYQTSAIIFDTNNGYVDNILIKNNFLSGGSYTVYLRDDDQGYGSPTNIRLIDNVFEYDSWAFDYLISESIDTYFSGNVYHTGVTMPVNPDPVPGNVSPTAAAGDDFTAVDSDDDGYAAITLDGTDSDDIDGYLTDYQWSENSVVLSTDAQPSISLGQGTHTITLTVTDDESGTDTDHITVLVIDSQTNQLPVADASVDQSVRDTDISGSESVSLDASGSYDPDGTISSYSWSEGGVVIASGLSPTVALGVGVHTITLTVTDDESGTDTDTVEITIEPGAWVIPGIDLDAVSSASVSYASSISWTHTLGSGDNRAVIVQLASSDGTLDDMDVSSITFDGAPMLEVPNSVATAGAGTRSQSRLYYLLEEDLPVSGTYTIAITRGGSVSRQSAGAISLENVAQQAPEAVATATGLDTVISTSITTLTDDGWIVDLVAHGAAGTWSTTQTGQSLQWQQNPGGLAHAASTFEAASAGSNVMSWSFSGSAHRIAHSLAAFAPIEVYDNIDPVADAGSDQTVNGTDGDGYESVTLDGSGSSDYENQMVSYIWTESGQQIASGINPTISLAEGTHTITLTVTDNYDATDTDVVVVTVTDVAAEIEFDSCSYTTINDASTFSWSHTLGDGDSRVVVVGLAAEDGTLSDFDVTSVTFDGESMTAVANSTATAGAGTRQQSQLFYILEEDLSTSGTYTVTVTRAGSITRQSAAAISLGNVAQQDPESVVAIDTTGTSVSTPITTYTDNAWIVDVIAQGNPGTWSVTGAAQDQRWSRYLSGAAHAGSTQTAGTAGSYDMSWSCTASSHLIAHSLAAFAPVQPASGIDELLSGDANLDGEVDIYDFLILKDNYGVTSGAAWSMGDFTGDGKVDISDFMALKANYGSVAN